LDFNLFEFSLCFFDIGVVKLLINLKFVIMALADDSVEIKASLDYLLEGLDLRVLLQE
jgi:hypothetical protein